MTPPVDRRRLLVLAWAAALAVLGLALVLSRSGGEGADAVVHGPGKGVVRRRPGWRPGPPGPAPTGVPFMFQGGPRHTGQSAFTGPRQAKRRWSFPTKGPVVAQPVIARDGTIWVGSQDHHLYSLGADGALRHRIDLGGPIYGAAAVFPDGRVVVGSDADRVVCVSPSGEVRWMLETGHDADTGIAPGADGEAYVGSGRELLALSRTGRLLWRFRAGDKVFTAPAVGEDGAIFFGSQDDHLYAVNSDGTMRWSYRTGGDVDSAPSLGADGTVYVGSDDARVHAVSASGRLLWSRPVGGAVRAGIAIARDGTLLVGTLGPRPRFLALDPSDGSERWSFTFAPVGSRDRGILSQAVVDAAGTVYFGAHDDYLYALRADGSMGWVFQTGADVDSGAAIAPDGTLVFGSGDHVIYALR
jgi:outer membrane protein assembly factor BamB